MVRRHCRAFRFDPGTLEELRQQIWVELVRRLRTYRYDPDKRFRSWLHRLCRFKAIDLLCDSAKLTLCDEPRASQGSTTSRPSTRQIPTATTTTAIPNGRRYSEGRNKSGRPSEAGLTTGPGGPSWSIAVEGGSVREAAETAGISYAAAFAAQKRRPPDAPQRSAAAADGDRFMITCPPIHVLQGLGRDPIEAAEFPAIERQVAPCPDCRDRLERSASLDLSEATFWFPGPSRPVLPEIPGFRIVSELGRGASGSSTRPCRSNSGETSP